MTALNTVQLLANLRKIAGDTHTFGVYPSNEIPLVFVKPAIFIVNTDPSFKSGSHWVSFHFPKFGSPEFFDSYGRSPSNENFKKIISMYPPKFKFNTHRLQGDFSMCCGHYCCLFAYYRKNNVSLRDFTNNFSRYSFDHNDSLVTKMYSKLFKAQQFGGCKSRSKIQKCKPSKKKI